MGPFWHVILLFRDRVQRTLALAVRSLWLHKLRAFLSVLGIIIGTAAVISLMAFGEGSMRDALKDIESQATNVVVRSVKPPDSASNQSRSFVVSYGLNRDDLEQFQLIDSVKFSVPMRVFRHEARYLDKMHVGRVVGTTRHYTQVHDIELVSDRCRFLTDHDEENMLNVAVLGSAVAESLFPFEDPLGKSIVLNKHEYRIVGIVKERMPTGGTGGSQAAEEFNSDVYIPLKTCRARFGERIYIRQSGARSAEQVELHQITLQVHRMDQVREVGKTIEAMLERTHYKKKDWVVTIPLDRLEEARKARDRYTRLLVVIASISLLVGGIGIMNIMLATVTERTREIGIRRALGAKRRDITLQFLVEAVVQTGIGGFFGVVLGLAIALGAPFVAENFFREPLPANLNIASIFLSLTVAVGVGILFGWYPAQRASRLDPIEALRHE
jgi:putative ABC transport system permease protein